MKSDNESQVSYMKDTDVFEDPKIIRYLANGETRITDDELQKRKKQRYLDHFFLNRLKKLNEDIEQNFGNLVYEREKDKERKRRRVQEQEMIREAVERKKAQRQLMLKLKQNLANKFRTHNQKKEKACRSLTPTIIVRDSSITEDRKDGDDHYSVSPSNCSCQDIDKRLAKAVRKERIKKQMKSLCPERGIPNDRITKRNVMMIKKQSHFVKTQRKDSQSFAQLNVFTIKLRKVKKADNGQKTKVNAYVDKENILVPDQDLSRTLSSKLLHQFQDKNLYKSGQIEGFGKSCDQRSFEGFAKVNRRLVTAKPSEKQVFRDKSQVLTVKKTLLNRRQLQAKADVENEPLVNEDEMISKVFQTSAVVSQKRMNLENCYGRQNLGVKTADNDGRSNSLHNVGIPRVFLNYEVKSYRNQPLSLLQNKKTAITRSRQYL